MTVVKGSTAFSVTFTESEIRSFKGQMNKNSTFFILVLFY